MSKQYLTAHTVDNAHVSDIYSLAATSRFILTGSGSSKILVHDAADPSFPLKQSIADAHKLGCHHVCVSGNGCYAATVGFGDEIKLWVLDNDKGEWLPNGVVTGSAEGGGTWAIAFSHDGGYLASTTNDGRANVWDVAVEVKAKVKDYETVSGGSGSFGMCVDLSWDGELLASGHRNGSIYVFNNNTEKIIFSLSGLANPVRAVAFSPGKTRLAASGDVGIIALYDLKQGEHICNLTGHTSWITSLDWSDTGEYLLSGSMDGKVKVWSMESGTCVATHSETSQALWAVRWIPKNARSEMFCTAGANKSISVYREATGC